MEKKTILAAGVALIVAICSEAAEVSSEEAKEAVAGWLALHMAPGEMPAGAPAEIKEYAGEGGKGKYYVVCFEGGGYAVASADTACEPVLAYAKAGRWEEDESRNPLMTMMSIEAAGRAAGESRRVEDDAPQAAAGRASAGAAAGDDGSPQAAVETKWARLRAAAGDNAPGQAVGRASAGAAKPSADLRVDFLVESSWNQSGHGENHCTPLGLVCGCVATMGGQLMRYWQWPGSSYNVIAPANFYADVVYSGYGKRGWNISDGYYPSYGATAKTKWNPAFGGTYDWSRIKLNPGSGDSTEYKAALGKLTRDVGLSCYMTYASGGSGSPGAVFGHRAVDTFGYANAKIASGWNDASRNALLASLDAGLPCGMNITGSSFGHAVVADGYGYDSDGSLYVHLNMGWGSTGENGTWYNLPVFSSGGHDFTSVDNIIYNMYPPSKGAPDLTVVSGRVLSGGNPAGGVAVKAVNRETGVAYSAVSSNGGSSCKIKKGVYSLMLPSGFYDITAGEGANQAKVSRQVHSCLSAVYGGAGGNPAVSGAPANIHGLDLVLGTAVAAPAVQLVRRWSFDGGLSDSVGGAAAEKMGQAVSVSGGMAKLSGGANGAGALDLGRNLLDTTAATVEIWARQNAVRNWSRIFDYGSGETRYFCLSWSHGTDLLNDRAGAKNTAEVYSDTTMAPYSLGVMYHIAATFERQSSGKTVVRWSKRDASTGLLLRSGFLEMPEGIQNMENPSMYLGRSRFSGDSDACADYDEVRIWKGVLSDAQLAANAKAGPDALPASAASEARYVAKAVWKGGGTAPTAESLANPANWTCSDQNGEAMAGVPGEKTIVIVPSGNTAFTIPRGVEPVWRRVLFGDEGAGTVWGSRGTANGSLGYITVAANTYEYKGEGSAGSLQRVILHNPSNNPAELAKKQLRYDGWFYADSSKAGHWTLQAYADDYVAFMVDGELLTYGRTMGRTFGKAEVSPGWHRFTLIAGDTGGGYGGCILASDHRLAPLTVKVDGGAELAFTPDNFKFGGGSNTVKLVADCDLRPLGGISVDNATTIDLNGHELRIDSATASFLGAKVASSAPGGTLAVYGTLDSANLAVDPSVAVATVQVSAPVLASSPRLLNDEDSMGLSCATEGAEIRWTLDGSEPTRASALYTGPVAVRIGQTLKAVAFKAGMLASETLSAVFTAAEKAAAAVPASTRNYRSETIVLTSDIEGATIHYTLDGTDPTESSPVCDGPLTFTSDGTLKAVVYAEGYKPGEVLTYEYFVKRLFGGEVGEKGAKYEDTPANRAAHWVEETRETSEATGVWSEPVQYGADGTIELDIDFREFTPDLPSAGRNVVLETTVAFEECAGELPEEPEGVKAGAVLGPEGRFMVYTADENGAGWREAVAQGFTPAAGTEYNLVFEFDCTNKTYRLSVVEPYAAPAVTNVMKLASNGSEDIKIAAAEIGPAWSVSYSGSGSVRSLYGSYNDLVARFSAGETVQVAGGAVSIAKEEADWLNARGEYAAVKAALAALDRDAFEKAYLLNLDFTADAYKDADPKYEFKVAGIDVGSGEIVVSVSLKRHGAAGGINGRLELYGGAAPKADYTAPLAVKAVSNATFSGAKDKDARERAEIRYSRTGAASDARFFQPRIVK